MGRSAAEKTPGCRKRSGAGGFQAGGGAGSEGRFDPFHGLSGGLRAAEGGQADILASAVGPKPAPGVVATLARSSSRSKKSQEPIPSGVLIQM